MTDESVFAQALAIGSPKERAAFLDRACAENPRQRKDVDELLAAHAASNALDRPPADLARTGAYESDDDGPPVAAVGDTIGSYRLMEQIGEGGFGLVFVAEQSEPVRRKVALKVLKPGMDTRDVVARFEAERQALALMDHPNIARVFDAGSTSQGRPYFAMELVRGLPITEYCDGQKLSTTERLALFVKVCQAVQHAHQKGVIHRDLKPSNVLVTLIDGDAVPKVIDFGVAKAVGQSLTEKTIYTRFAQIVGTPLYMSPEQAEMSGVDVDTRADVYALGVLLYELLTGTTPFDRVRFSRAGFDEMRRIIREEEPPRPSTRLSSLGDTLTSVSSRRGTDPSRLAGLVRGELDWIAMRCLEKDRNRRYDSATALAKDVQRYLIGDAVEACPPTLGYRLRKAYRRNRLAIRVGGAFVGMALGAAVVGAMLAVQAKRAEALATSNEESARIAEQVAKENQEKARRAEADAVAERDKVAKANAALERVSEMQRRTRYAAEMNLLEAAHHAHDTQRVRTLLLDQIPKPGEQDVRGPEWHYWHRKLNGHVREAKVPYIQGEESFTSDPSSFALSSDGSLMAAAAYGSSEAGREGEYAAIRVWDTESQRLLGQIKLDTKRFPGADRIDFFAPAVTPQLWFSKDGKRLLVSAKVRITEAGGFRWPVVHVVWDWQTGAVMPGLFPLDTRDTGPAVIDGLPAYQGYFVDTCSDQLDTVCRVYHPRARGSLKSVRVVRITDGRVLLDQTGDAALSPDGKHVLIRTRESYFPALPGVASAVATLDTPRLACWSIGESKLVWEVDWPRGPGTLAGRRIDRPWFGPDGTTFWRISQEDGRYVQSIYSLETGRPVRTTPLFDETFLNSLVAGGEDRFFQERADGSQMILLSRHGLEVLQLPATGNALPKSIRLPCIDGFPHQFGQRPDGTLITLHVRDDLITLRFWSDPHARTANDREMLWLGNTHSCPDRSTFAFMRTDPGRKSGSYFSFAGTRTFERPRELVVMSAAGKRLLTVDWSKGIQPAAFGVYRGILPIFSNDGRILYLPETDEADPKSPRIRVSIHDLSIQSILPGLQLEPGEALDTPVRNMAQDRLLFNVVSRDDARKLRRAFLYDFASGRLISELAPPPGAELQPLFIRDDGFWGVGSRKSSGETRAHKWDMQTGAHLGLHPIRPYKSVDNSREAEIRSGSSILRRSQRPHVDKRVFFMVNHIEVFTVDPDGGTRRPLLHFEASMGIDAYMSPDGARLLLITYYPGSNPAQKYKIELYCLRTGRLMLNLPELEESASVWGLNYGVGYWSPDSQRFWTHMKRDGTLAGLDFSPIAEPKK